MSSCLFYSMMKSFFNKILKNRLITGTVIALFAFLFSLLLVFIDVFNVLELKSYDLRFSWRGPAEVDSSEIVIVGIDDQSFEDLQLKWPFPRRLFARAVQNLRAAGARLIILDLEFVDPDQFNPGDDRLLAEAARAAGNVVFAADLISYKKQAGSRLLKPIAPLLESGASWALINVPEDLDGFNRRYYIYRRSGDEIHVPFAMLAYQKITKQKLQANDGALVIGANRIPSVYNTFLINFRGPAGTIPTYSFSSILDDRRFDLGDADADIFELHRQWGTFAGKIVFIGASSEVLQDVKFTPFYGYAGSSQKMPGVEIHANALSTLMRGDYIRRVSPGLQVLLILVLAVLMTYFAMYFKRPLVGLLVGLAIGLAYTLIVYLLFLKAGYWLELVRPIMAISTAYVGTVIQQVVFERREKGRVRRTFQQYVAKNVVDKMLATGEDPRYGGERRELTVLFSDIRSFTNYCERHSPEGVVHTLNEYLTVMVDTIFRHNGTLDKFVGDEIMALFGAPLSYPEHPIKACETACEMIDRLRVLQKKWARHDQDYFQIGIGVNTGKMIVGNLGSQQLFDYTVIGDEVNLAARLEGANKQYWTTIIISESTYVRVQKQAVARELDLVRVKGKNKPVKIYELRSMKAVPRIEQDLIVDVYTKGLELYKRRSWYDAIKEFKRVIRYFPSDGPSRVYIKRCLDFIEQPPPEEWDGVFEFKTK